MDDKPFIYWFVFHKDYSIYKAGTRFGNIEIIFAQTHEEAKTEILDNLNDILTESLYTSGILELHISEFQLLDTKSFYCDESEDFE